MKKALLALEDGSVFEGVSVGKQGTIAGEVVFNTSMTGYQEILTDPSYRGQIVTLTYPLIGNYGVNEGDLESDHPQARGLVVRELCTQWNSWRGEGDADTFLVSHDIVGIAGVDTRALTRVLRERGTMRGALSSEIFDRDALVARAQQEPGLSEHDWVLEVTTPEPYGVLPNGQRIQGPALERYAPAAPHVVLMDFGAKRNILRSLSARGCRVTVVPAQYSAADVLALQPRAVVLSNGPGDPERCTYAVQTVRDLIGQVPLFGICLGHQLLGLALGGRTFKLKYGHRGANHPVKDLRTGQVTVTSQNHGFAVDEESLDPREVMVSHRNLNDGTVEGLQHRRLPLSSVQFHPEAAPGPRDSGALFDQFLESVLA